MNKFGSDDLVGYQHSTFKRHLKGQALPARETLVELLSARLPVFLNEMIRVAKVNSKEN